MKRIITVLATILFTASLFLPKQASTQTPQKMSYQAVIRNSDNMLITSTLVGMQISILQGSLTGKPVYVELHFPITNSNGLVTIEIGGGTLVSGSYTSIDWAKGTYFLKSETDLNGGEKHTITGISQLLSVPYAKYAENAGNGFSGNYNHLSNKPTIDGSETKLLAGSNITVTGSGTNTSPYVINSIANVNGGITIGDMLYWNGTYWMLLPAGTPGQVLSINSSNVPVWKNESSSSLLAPTATTLAASNIQIASAILNGTVNANGLSTTVSFEWGLTISYGNVASVIQSPVTGTSNVPVRATISGLQGNTLCHYRIKATNAVNVTYSSDMTFTTSPPVVPTVTTAAYYDIKGNSAKAGGSVTYNGGSTITAQGLCWSKNPNPTTVNSFVSSFTETISGLLPKTVYYVRAYATNSAGTGYGNQISFNSGNLIGSTAFGGLVFYNDGNSHGLVCASTDQSTPAGAEWGCEGTAINGTFTEINTGAANTNAIVAVCTTAGIAAKLCHNLTLNSYSDWFLPARDELKLMYTNLHTQGLGDFIINHYWSSSSENNTNAWFVFFYNGATNPIVKTHTFHVRAVRAF